MVHLVKQHQELKNPQFTQLIKDALPPCSVKHSEYSFEMVFGQCNIFDLLRDGKFMKVDPQTSGLNKTQFIKVQTFLLTKLSLFLKEDKVMFLPKTDADLETALREC